VLFLVKRRRRGGRGVIRYKGKEKRKEIASHARKKEEKNEKRKSSSEKIRMEILGVECCQFFLF